MRFGPLLPTGLLLLVAACAVPDEPGPVLGAPAEAATAAAVADAETGEASWYGQRHHGKLTASGERFDMNGLSAAHPSLPFGTELVVTNLANGRTVKVRINDRGPHRAGFVLDLSARAASEIGLRKTGTASVSFRTVAS